MSERISTSEWRNATDADKAQMLKRVAKRRPVQREHFEQVALVEWARRESRRVPALTMLFAIPNGGKRSKAVAGKLKAEGVKAGIPDICLPVARGKYHGLFIELKAPGGTATDTQRGWLADLSAQGYCARLCVGWHAAKETIENYLRQGGKGDSE